MEVKNRVTIINEDNFCRLLNLYGEVSIDDLERIVNKHITIALDEIEEDLLKHNKWKSYDNRYPNRKETDFTES